MPKIRKTEPSFKIVKQNFQGEAFIADMPLKANSEKEAIEKFNNQPFTRTYGWRLMKKTNGDYEEVNINDRV